MSTRTVTGTGQSAASAESAASRPRSVSTGGWTPRTRLRSSTRAAWPRRAPPRRAPGALRVGGEPGLGPAQVHGQGDQPLLGAVVQVALDPAALGVGGVDHPGPAALELADPGGQLRAAAAGPDHPPGEGSVQRGHALGHARRGQQQDQADRRRDRQLDRGGRQGRADVKLRMQLQPQQSGQSQHGQREGPQHDHERGLGQAERQPQQRVAEAAPGRPGREQLPDLPRPAGVGVAQHWRGRRQLDAQQDGEPDLLGASEAEAHVQHPGQHGQAGQEEPQRGQPEQGHGADHDEAQGAGDRPGQQVDEGQPGRGGPQRADSPQHHGPWRRPRYPGRGGGAGAVRRHPLLLD